MRLKFIGMQTSMIQLLKIPSVELKYILLWNDLFNSFMKPLEFDANNID